MRRCLILYGLTFTATLIFALREILLLFQGNELALPPAVAAVLLFLAAALWAAGRWVRARTPGTPSVTALLFIGGRLLPATLLYLRALPWLLDTPPLPLTHPRALALLLPLALLGLIPSALAAALFLALATAIAHRTRAPGHAALAQVLFHAALGSALAGLLALLLLGDLSALQAALALAALCALTAFVVWWHDDRRARPWGWLLAPVCVALALAAATRLSDVADFLSLTPRHPGALLRASWESPRGRVDVVTDAPAAVLFNSAPIAPLRPDREEQEAVLAALLAHPAPRRLLILGAFPGPALRTALTLPWLRVDVLPLEPSLADAHDYAPPEDRRAGASPRVRIEHDLDPRLLLLRSASTYDVIFLDLPLPVGGPISRLASPHLLLPARNALAPGGVLVAALPAASLPGDPAPLTLVAGLARALPALFPSASVLPGARKVFFFAAREKRPALPDIALWPARIKSWNLRPLWLTETNLRAMTSPARFDALRNALRAAPPAATNAPLHPASHTATLAALRFADAAPLAWAARLDFTHVAFVILLGIALCALILTLHPSPRSIALTCAALLLGLCAGAILAALLLSVQSLHGTLYGQAGLIAGLSLLGLALGARIASRPAFEVDPAPVLAALQTAFAIAAAALALLLPAMTPANPLLARLLAEAGIPALALVAGFIVGLQWPLLILLTAEAPEPPRGPEALWPVLCALAGAALGVAGAGTLVIPALGAPSALMGVGLLALAAPLLLLLALRKPSQRAAGTPAPPPVGPDVVPGAGAAPGKGAGGA